MATLECARACAGGAALQALDGGGGGEDAAPLSRERRASDGSLRIGELHVSTTVLGHGSSTHGTTVFEGSLSGRQVAVKRMLMQFHEVARKEFDALVASDEHANVLRCFAWERSDPWVYLALERCDLTLYDAFTQPDPHGRFPQPGDPPTELTLSIALGCIRGVEVRVCPATNACRGTDRHARPQLHLWHHERACGCTGA